MPADKRLQGSASLLRVQRDRLSGSAAGEECCTRGQQQQTGRFRGEDARPKELLGSAKERIGVEDDSKLGCDGDSFRGGGAIELTGAAAHAAG